MACSPWHAARATQSHSLSCLPPYTPAGLPPHHWRQVLQGLALTPQQKQHIATSYKHMLQQLAPLLQARHQLGVQLAAAAKPATFSWVHMVQRELQVSAGAGDRAKTGAWLLGS
jgi:hypothetical protein